MSLCIRHLRIEDFRAFQGAHDFAFGADPEQHLELISGPNGSGKSTIIEALKLCFFGDQNENDLRTYVNQQLVDEIEVDEKATAQISVELIDPEISKNIEIVRKVSTLKTPTGKKDVVENPVVRTREKNEDWKEVDNPQKYLDELIPSDVRPFSFFDPEQILGFDTWEGGPSYKELVHRARILRNRAAHDLRLDESANVDVSVEYLNAINQTLTEMEREVELDESEEFLTVGSLEDDGHLLSKSEQLLISFGLILAAGELEGVNAPVIMDVPFARVDQNALDTMCEFLREASQRQVIIVGFPDQLDEVADSIGEIVASYYNLEVNRDATVEIRQKI
jgi:DNA repair exonuclease SbcCD ATPase subunit